jgi:chromosome segregation ATPase
MTVDTALSLLGQTEEKLKMAKEAVDQKIQPNLEKLSQISSILDKLKESISSKKLAQDELKNELDEKTLRENNLISSIQQKQTDFEQARASRASNASDRDAKKNTLSGKRDVLNEVTGSITSCQVEIENLEEVILAKEQEIAEIKTLRDEFSSREAELNLLVEEQNAFLRQCLALSYLVKESHLSSPEVDVIKALSKVGIDNKTRLLNSVNVSATVVEGILSTLESKGIMSIDEEGLITTNFEVEKFR